MHYQIIINMNHKNGYDKINFLYEDSNPHGFAYMFFDGLKDVLNRNGLLYYSYDIANKSQRLNLEELLKYPILCFKGSWDPTFNIVKLVAGKQFIAEFNSESLFPEKESFLLINKLSQKKNYIKLLKLFYYRKTSDFIKLLRDNIFKPVKSIDYYNMIKERKEYFDLYFIPVEEDLNSYLSFGKPCYWIPSWTHTELLDNINLPACNKIGFIGGVTGPRIKFFAQDKNKIIECIHTIPKDNELENIKELCKAINKYKYLVCPMGISVRTMPGKVFEYMACKRLCFCYLNDEYMFKHKLLFEDGKEIVYFKTFNELEEKYRYYLAHPQEAVQIAQAGYEKVRKYHNADIRVQRLVELILYHANGGEYNNAFNDVSFYGGHS